MFLTTPSRSTNAPFRAKFERAGVVSVGDSIQLKAPAREDCDGGPVVYVPDSARMPLSWNLVVVGLVADPKSSPAKSDDLINNRPEESH